MTKYLSAITALTFFLCLYFIDANDRSGNQKGEESQKENIGSAAGSGDGQEPDKRKNNKNAEPTENETTVIVVSDQSLPNGVRLLKVAAVIRPENLGQGTNTNNSIAKNWKKKLNLPEDYHAGHIIGSMLGGSGSNLSNLVPMHSGFNNGSLKSFEFRVRNLIKQCQNENPGKSVEAQVFVSLLFAPGGKVPYNILYGVRLAVNGVIEARGYAAVFNIKCCSNGHHEGPSECLEDDYYYTDEH